MTKKLGLAILISIILTIILVSTVNVGTSLFLNEPEYEDYCDYRKPIPRIENMTQEHCEEGEGIWHGEDYCDLYSKYHEKDNEAREHYNQQRFYVFALLGFSLLLIGLFTKELMIQITGLATGGILVFQGIVMNLQDKLVVFISLLAILIIFGVLAYRVVNSK